MCADNSGSGFSSGVHECMVVDRKSLTEAQRKIYRKNHSMHGILVEAMPQSKYTKIVDKSTTKAIFVSLCSTYEAKANLLVQQYELFTMKDEKTLKRSYSV